ncbi:MULTISPECIES: PH domain-containing protein [Gammaproteobacteria]|uniref:PH domain-containing protein n=1 Tax=Gammaproteobacteria TaxID=1236 RepID=UPI000C77AE51|nr:MULTISPECIES: PH domain-containing protein [Gammaproteobacteria]MBO9482004.1 PH domain-containing protein [Salinisphaera sp. G21_0]MBO9494148.1 PH domain-containing protein [Thalassotalea sp. G20_0]
MGLFDALLGNAGEMSNTEAMEDLATILNPSESIELAYKLVRDMVVLTNHRLILIDKQGLTGRKVEYRSIPYKSITMFTVESVGHFDLDAELKIWISGQPESMQMEFNSKTNIYKLQAILAAKVAGQ